MASVEVDLIRQLTRTLHKVWLVHGTGDAFSVIIIRMRLWGL